MEANNIIECLYSRVGSTPNAPVYYFNDIEVSFKQLASDAEILAAHLKNAGVKIGNRVAILMNDSPAMAKSIIASMGIGAIPVVINTLLAPQDVAYILKDCDPTALIISQTHINTINSAIKEDVTLPNVIISDGIEVAPGYLKFDDVLKGNDKQKLAALCEDAVMMYTSGSTGRPKGVVHGHGGLMTSIRTMGAQVYKLTPNDRLFSAPRMFFAYGFANSVAFPIGLGAPSILCSDRPNAEIIVNILRNKKPTVFFGVPTVFRLVAEEIRKTGGEKFPALKFSAAGGENLTSKTFNDWKELTGTIILETIGATETVHGFLTNRLDSFNPESSGQVTPGYEVKLIDDEGNEFKGAGKGRIWVKGGSTFKRYWNNPEATNKTIVNGWIGTGDLYNCDDQGFYYFEGRGDDMIKVSGLWVSPVDVEQILITNEKVKEAAVVGKESSSGIFDIYAYFVPTDDVEDISSLIKDLEASAELSLPRYKRPKYYVELKELPRNPTGKILRFKLRQS